MTEPRPVPRRRDARRNREAILRAARELFAESGDVPMSEVARRAGVGQATLYRNFPDRGALVTALFAEQLAQLERLAGEHAGDPDAFFVLLRAVIDMQTRFHGLVDCVGDASEEGSELAALQPRFVALVRRALRDAKTAGLVRRDLTVDDVFLLMGMVEGALSREADATARATAAARALAIALGGLASPNG